jgi:prepilin-type N-terminal cleavage/methylation domain-containing protein
MLTRIREDESGFGLVELLIAMMILSIGVLAIVAAFSSGAVALRRASGLSTATAIADTHMERFRAIRYSAIGFDGGELAQAGTDQVYTGDAPKDAAGALVPQVVVTCASPLPPNCDPSRSVTGPDGKPYRVSTYIVERVETHDSAGSDVGRPVKVVTVVVRDERDLTKALIRQQSTFDRSFG